MKKFFYLFTILLIVQGLSAQKATDWMLTDINGDSHHLYSDLGDDKYVLMDFSATWCGPCWVLHQTKILEDLHNVLGPDGADAMRVYYFESDPSTTTEDLFGTGSNTWGNWVDGTSYPMIDFTTEEAQLVNDYNITGYPSLMLANPNDTTFANEYKAGWGFESIFNVVAEGTSFKDGTDLLAYSGSLSPENCGDLTGSMTVINVRNSDVENPEFDIMLGGEVISSFTYEGTVSAQSIVEIDVPAVALQPGVNEVEIMYAGTDDNMDNNAYSTVVQLPYTENLITVSVVTDQYASVETQFSIVDADGKEYYSSGFLPNSTTFEAEVWLPELGCYFVEFTDSYGDGILLDNPITIMDNATAETYDFEFTGSSATMNVYVNSLNSANEIASVESFNLAPNPVQNELKLNMQSTEKFVGDITITDNLGRTIMTQNDVQFNANNYTTSIDVSNYSAGLYHLHVISEDKVVTQKFIKQ